MEKIRPSKLRIVEDHHSSDPNIIFARVASPLLTEEEAPEEIKLFIEQQRPADLVWRDTVELVNPRGDVIGGAIIWEAAWERETVAVDKLRATQEIDAARYVLAQGFEQTQNAQAPRLN